MVKLSLKTMKTVAGLRKMRDDEIRLLASLLTAYVLDHKYMTKEELEGMKERCYQQLKQEK